MSDIVRLLQLTDIESVQRIDRSAHGQCWSHRTFVDQIDGTDRLHLVVVRDGAIVAHGALWFDRTQARITNVAVAAAHKREGLGAFVVRHLCEHARANPDATMLTLEVAPANRAAQGLYRSFGFMPVGIERGFYGPGRDALVMSVHDLDDPEWVRQIAARVSLAVVPTEGAVA